MESARNLCRLIFLMALCGFFAFWVSSHALFAYDVDPTVLFGDNLRVGIVGTALGACLELYIRGWGLSRRVTIWGMLEITAMVAIGVVIGTLWVT
jgi:hypothetical protein